MDLYRTLRVSLYLLAGTGAFAISVAERSFFYLALIAVLGVLSYLTIDRAKFKPLSAEITAGLTLVLLYLCLRPLHDDDHWQAHFPAAVAHFLCAWQGLLFFSVYGGPVLLTYCGSSLAVVVMSGVVQSGPSLVARVGCFLIVAVWTLYIHAMWRSRQEFAGLPTMLQSADTMKSAEPAPGQNADAFMRLPEGAFWSTLVLVTGMTVACSALGVAVFFSAPRIESLLSPFEKRNAGGDDSSNSAKIATGRKDDPSSVAGFPTNVSVNHVGRIEQDGRVALKATFSVPVSQLAGTKGRVLLKAMNYSDYRNGDWSPDVLHTVIDARPGTAVIPRDASLDGSVFRGEDVEQIIEPSSLHMPNYFAAGPVLKIKARSVETDAEGSLRNPGGASLERYSLTVSTPYNSNQLTDKAIAAHRDLQRYVRQNGLPPGERERVGRLARSITQRGGSDAAKARDIQRWLETNRRYSMNLERLASSGDAAAHFLLTSDPEQARGHCGLFATAFVLLCRANDMPARLCSGFAARVDPADVQAKSVIATNSDAHAWAEIYFQGIGWVAFDPTPGAPSPAVAASTPSTAPQASTQPLVSSVAKAPPEKEASRGFVQDWWDATLKYNGYEQRKLYEKLSGSSGERASESSTSKRVGGWLGIALTWAGLGGALAWLVHMFSRRNGRRKYPVSPGPARSRAAVAFYNDLLQALSRRGYSRRPDQTPREFAESVLRRGGAAFAPVRDVTDIFESVRYGGGDLEQDEFNRLQDALDQIRDVTF
ncbi:MAG: transglutaminase domain-containing protein [Planctomycetota bacterium]